MATSLLTLLDDIATLLDDVAVISKVAAQKTAGVLGDDLALNAEQVSGVKAQREIPVVWAVAKGSFLNKLILVPSALLISVVYPPLIVALLVVGALYLCFEGFEKVFHKLTHSKDNKNTVSDNDLEKELADSDVDLEQFEKDKIKGAIRTDFVLSAEIIVIILGTAKDEPFLNQVLTLSLLSIAFTAGVYGLVAAIVKLDDLGLYLHNKGLKNSNDVLRKLGGVILKSAPLLMRSLSIIGTAAMFLVGGGILAHDIHFLHVIYEQVEHWAEHAHSIASLTLPLLTTLVIGILAGSAVFGGIKIVKKMIPTKAK
ncbi:DUF808 domain-containing protein [Alteromonas sp. 5E99-2]|uniref:DUF808 family protein n=1 Tax=Alteromonas sp. 5E99-2 TaxID=2817683 RepID=UPI001A984DB8|nr:DUF808 domain-containing protein [Alteromonas sp. 5E99-2]